MPNFYNTEETKQFLLRVLVAKEEMAAELDMTKSSRDYWTTRCLEAEAKVAKLDAELAKLGEQFGTVLEEVAE